jgi:circadian clock protein KaiB
VRSLRAIHNLESICAAEIGEGVQIEIVDLAEHPERASADAIVALPTLVRKFPLPERKIIGDLSDLDRVRVGLEIVA